MRFAAKSLTPPVSFADVPLKEGDFFDILKAGTSIPALFFHLFRCQPFALIFAWAAASLAIGTRNGEQDT